MFASDLDDRTNGAGLFNAHVFDLAGELLLIRRAEQLTVAVAECREFALVDRAAQHGVVMPRRQPGDLQAQRPLLAPEPRQRRIGVRLAEDPVGDAARMVGGILHRFEASHRALRMPRGEGAAIADRRNIDVGGQEFLIDEDAVGHREPGRRGQLAIRHDADADQHQIGLEPLAAGQFDMIDPAAERARVAPGDPHRLRAEAELDTGLAMRGGEEFRSRRAHHPTHHSVGQFEDMDRPALAARDRGEFEPDKAGADHHDMLGRSEPLAQLIGLGQRAQIAHPVELDPGQRRDPVARTGRQHEVVVIEPLSGSEAQALRGPVDLGGARPGEVIDPVVAVELLRPHQQQIEADLAVEIVLRQRRPLVRQHRLLAEQDYGAVEPALAQRGGQLKSAMPRADDDHALGSH